MANFRYFTHCGGAIVRLQNVWHDGHVSAAAEHWTGTCPVCGSRHKAERVIEFKAWPTMHKCDARCETAKGHKCECSCGGANHGKAA